MRGKENYMFKETLKIGITPAYAGKRIIPRRNKNHQQDHPRVCGEKHANLSGNGQLLGSPPRMRGKVIEHLCTCTHCRITPAYAGKRYSKEKTLKVMEDHPRVCGEKRVVRQRKQFCQGSPPRMRGKVCKRLVWLRALWITPAYAGKRPLFSYSSGLIRDHPRVCGEKLEHIKNGLRPPGSPPGMRGKV